LSKKIRTEMINLVGAGGHSLVVIDSLLAGGWSLEHICLWDEDVSRTTSKRLDIQVRLFDPSLLSGQPYHVCIGNSKARANLVECLDSKGGYTQSIYHPATSIAGSAKIGPGTFLASGAIVGPLAHIGRSVIVNHGAVVDHECTVGDFSHIAPGATLGGNVRVGEGVLVGAGASVLPGIRICDGAVVGAGAVVVADIAQQGVYAGIPANRIG
jgi:sugar O-acyltransferase (sialic acid O-acetyltransferase NeuD family)